jgi:hypothetical protein
MAQASPNSDKRIYDCFIFYNELEALHLRLHELYDRVDQFVLCEADRTFKGDPKPLIFSENRHLFAPFLDKIRVVEVHDMPADGSAWDREYHQRQAIRRGLFDAGPDDIVMISDVDEIISATAVDYLRRNTGYFVFDMPMYQFYLNMRALADGWAKAFAYQWDLDAEVGDYNHVRHHETATFNRFEDRHHWIRSAGWHFTFLGGAERVRQKLGAYSHAESWQQRMLQPGAVERQLSVLQHVGGGLFLDFCAIDETFPRYLRDNLDQFRSGGLVKDALSRIHELTADLTNTAHRVGAAEARARYLSAELERAATVGGYSPNLALGKPATQSSIGGWSTGKTPEDDARGGNNGYLREPGAYGFHTEWEMTPWWQVDLEDVFLVEEIRIRNRQGDTAWRLRHFTLLRSDDGETWVECHRKQDDAIFDASPYVVRFDPAVPARFIRIRLDAQEFLHFDQCMIYGRKPDIVPDIVPDTGPDPGPDIVVDMAQP